jgi:quercetin dioxygenase-like cupin family protein
LYTGFADADTIERAGRAGASAVLQKPIERDELRAAVESVLTARPAGPYTGVLFEQFEADARADGYDEVVERRWDAGAVLDTHRHPFAVDALMIAGDLWLTRHDETRHFRPGDRFHIPRDEPHAERYGREGAVFWIARRHRL